MIGGVNKTYNTHRIVRPSGSVVSWTSKADMASGDDSAVSGASTAKYLSPGF